MVQTKLDRAIRSSSKTFLFAFTGLVVAASVIAFVGDLFSSGPSKSTKPSKSADSKKPEVEEEKSDKDSKDNDTTFNSSLVSKSNLKEIPLEQQFADTYEKANDDTESETGKKFDNNSDDPRLWDNGKLKFWLENVSLDYIFSTRFCWLLD